MIALLSNELVAFALIFPVLYTKGPSWIAYYTKFILYYTSLTISSSICLPLTLLRPKDPRNMLWLTSTMRATASLLGLRISIVDLQRARQRLSEEAGPAIVVLNHQSSIDLLTLFCELGPIMGGRCTFIAKKSLLYTGPFGLMIYMSGSTFIDRQQRDKAINMLNAAAAQCKESNFKLVIFAEGTRRHDPEVLSMNPFKLGAFNAAKTTRLPIQPVVISHYDFYDAKHSKTWNPGFVRLHVMDPISEVNDPKKCAELTREEMLTVFQEDALQNPRFDKID